MSKIIYTTGSSLYTLAIKVAALWNSKAKLWVNGRKNWQEKLQAFSNNNTKPIIWMHCASLGEFEQGRPILETLKNEYTNYAVVITFFSPSGYEVQKEYDGADYVCYLPNNIKSNANTFISTLKPKLVFWVKYDFWHNYLECLVKQRIPTLLVSAKFRPSQPFFKFYGSYWKKMLHYFHQLFVQDEASITLLENINMNHCQIAGDTRFDRVVQLSKETYYDVIIEQFISKQKCVIAGSTWSEDDEEICHYANLHPEIKFIVAPHHIDEDRLQEIEKLYTNTIRYSKWDYKSEANVLILDNIGMLSYLYRYADVCYVGGGFGADGVHNTLEPAAYGKPILIGPEFEKYQEAVDLEEIGVAIVVTNALEMEESLNDLLEDVNDDYYLEKCMAAKEYVQNNIGSTTRIIRYAEANRLLTKS